MESEFLLNLTNISIQVIIISIMIFALTMLIKWPIKKATSNLEENKRKAVNTIIVFIPIVLSFILSVLYFGLFENKWFENIVFDTMGSSYVLAVAFYAIYSRTIVLIKGCKNDNKKLGADLSKETIAYVKQNVKALMKALKVDKSKLETIVTEIEKLLSIRKQLQNNLFVQDISQVEKIDNQLKELESQKSELTSSISNKETEIENYQKTLSKGE